MPRKVFDKTFKIAAVKLILEEGQSIKIPPNEHESHEIGEEISP
ncbi:hypothetical protein P7J64_05490 [Streptococcus suis]|nr:hypothetical protein [Streptococcus suis]